MIGPLGKNVGVLGTFAPKSISSRTMLASAGFALLTAFVPNASAEEPPVRWGIGGEAGIALNQFENVGPFLGIAFLADWRATERFHVRGEVGPIFASHSATKSLEFHEPGVSESNTDSRSLWGVPISLLGALRIAGAVSFEFGALAGPMWTATDSTQCGKGSESGLAWGFRGGPALALGERQQYQLAIHAHLLSEPLDRCVNSGGDVTHPFAPRFRVEDDLQPGFTGRFGLYF